MAEPTAPRATQTPSPPPVTGDPRKGLIDKPSSELTKVGTSALGRLRSKIMRPAMTSHYWVDVLESSSLYSFFVQKQISVFNNKFKTLKEIDATLSISCCDAVLPGSTLYTHEIQNDRTGVTEKIPYRRVYDDQVSFSFYVDVNYTALVFFEAWMAFISGENDVKKLQNSNYFYRMPYPESDPNTPNASRKYRTNISITKFEKNYGNKEGNSDSDFIATGGLKYTFLDAYPISIDSIPVSYDGSSLLKVTVGFSFTRYYLS